LKARWRLAARARPGWVLLGGLLCGACATRPLPQPPRAPATAPGALLARLQAQEDSVRTLRVRFSSVARYGDAERTADGVLLVKKPDRFRVRLFAPFGFTVLDYTSVRGEVHVTLPLQGERLTGADLPADGGLAPVELRQAFLRAAAGVAQGCDARAADGNVLVSCRDTAGTLVRTLRIDPATGWVREEVNFLGGQSRSVTRFGDYRPVDALQLPFAIEMIDTQRPVAITITVRGYEVNPVLADELFDSEP
jgi:outer membrane lipoprotein-sorting protein